MNKGSIVERLCSDLDRKEPRYKSPTLLYSRTHTSMHAFEISRKTVGRLQSAVRYLEMLVAVFEMIMMFCGHHVVKKKDGRMA